MHFEIYGDVKDLKCASVQACQVKQNVYLYAPFNVGAGTKGVQSWVLRPFVTHEKNWV